MSQNVVNPYRYVPAAPSYPDGLGSDADLIISGVGYNFQQTGKVGTYSLQFTGNTGQGTISLSSGLDLSSAMTISLWTKNTAWKAGGSASQVYKTTTTDNEIYLYFTSTTYKNIRTEGGLGTMDSGTLSLDTWYNVVLRFDGTDSDYWINGAEVGTGSGSLGSFTTSWIGIDSSGAHPLNGYIDEFGLWTRAITDDEIADLYDSGTGAKINSIDTTALRIYYDFEQGLSPITNVAIP